MTSISGVRGRNLAYPKLRLASIYNGGTPSEGVFLYTEKIRDILSRPHLRALAVSSGFCNRSSKLKPEAFFDMLFYTVSNICYICSETTKKAERFFVQKQPRIVKT